MVLEILYAVIAGLSDIFGGWLGFKTRISSIMPRYIIGFAAGLLLSLTFVEILPEINVQLQGAVVASGFFVFYIIEKLTMLHACGEDECTVHKLSGITVAGMALDNIVDGVGIAVGYLTNPLLGLVITLGVVVHEIPQGITSVVVMKHAGYSKKKTYLILFVAAALYPIGALVSSFIPKGVYESVLAFVAGGFLYIGASDLLPEAHKKFNKFVILSVLLGIAFVLLLGPVFHAI